MPTGPLNLTCCRPWRRASAASAAKPLEWDAEYWGEELEQFFACWGRVGRAVMAQENARRLERGP